MGKELVRPLHPGGALLVGAVGMAAPCQAGTAPPHAPELLHSLFWDVREFEKKSLLCAVFLTA